MKKIVFYSLVLLMLFCTTSCNYVPNNGFNNNDPNNGYVQNVSDIGILTSKYNFTQNSSAFSPNNIVSFYDENYYYYVFDMGVIENVPLSQNYEHIRYGGNGQLEERVTVIEMTATQIKNNVTTAISRIEYNTDTENFTFNGKSVTKFNIGPVKQQIEVGAAYSKVSTEGKENTDSWSSSFEECASYTTTVEKTRIIKFDETCSAGYYAYRFVGYLKLYAVVIIDIESLQTDSPKVNIDTYTKMITSGYHFDYNPTTPVFDDSTPEISLDFDASIITQIGVPKVYVGVESGGDNNLGVGTLGTKNNPFPINDYNDFINAVNSSTEGLYYRMECDGIDFSNYNYTPVAVLTNHIDLNGKTISGFNFTVPSGESGNYGIFKSIGKNGSVSNGSFVDCSISGMNYDVVNVGIVCGTNQGAINNCTFINNKIELDSDSKRSDTMAYTGIVAGVNEGMIDGAKLTGGNIINLDADTQNDSDNNVSRNTVVCIGGVVGVNKNAASVLNCSNTATASAPSSFYGRSCWHRYSGTTREAYCGGIIGINEGEQAYNTVDDTNVSIRCINKAYSYNSFWGSWAGEESTGNVGKICGKQ